jgi:hypothetical protein
MSITSGEWSAVVTDGEYEIVTSDGGFFVGVAVTSPGDGDPGDNARMMAAAPDLYRHLKLALAHIRQAEVRLDKLHRSGISAASPIEGFDREAAEAALEKAKP